MIDPYYKLRASLNYRISRSMSNDITMNELSLEDTTRRCRPYNLANRYKELETVEWLAAKEELDSIHYCKKEIVTQYLCDVFVMVGQASNQSVEPTDMQNDLQRKVKGIIQERSDKCNIDDIIKRVQECMSKKEKYQPHILTTVICSGNKKGLKTYISECCRLAWRMNVQTPPMTISVETGIPFDPTIHERAYDCESIVGDTEMIDYYVWPTLFDAENHLPVRQKGRVYTKRSLTAQNYLPPLSSV
ncbi:PREDICTED: uncharacterized protein LOC109468202 [Branchiostoma belcheri]|uniref:Mitochondria-eating protein n=1 Tax=Branchiostoma belcheri TaxID=7741 RepID=A0A6P4YXM4_BRABE|nr:PREDICTED: uncharacterized protein LOC109468202 [Branchiostoma belcheri]